MPRAVERRLQRIFDRETAQEIIAAGVSGVPFTIPGTPLLKAASAERRPCRRRACPRSQPNVIAVHPQTVRNRRGERDALGQFPNAQDQLLAELAVLLVLRLVDETLPLSSSSIAQQFSSS